MSKGKIGIFDSGIGGLAVANLILDTDPSADILYLADNEFFPYGEKHEYQIKERLDIGIDYLRKQGCRLILIACNTASVVYEQLNPDSPDDILLVTSSLKQRIDQITHDYECIVMATKYTVKSRFYRKVLEKKISPDNIHGFALPDLVEYVENGQDGPMPPLYIPMPGKKTVVILACTHFHYLKDSISRRYNGCSIIDSAHSLYEEFIGREETFTGNNEKIIVHTNLNFSSPANIRESWKTLYVPFHKLGKKQVNFADL